MKQILLVVLLCSTYAFAQNDSIAEQEKIASENYRARDTRFMTDMRVMYIMPDAVGDNFMAKGQNGMHGFGLRFGIFKIHNLIIAVGGEILRYKTSDPAYGGNNSGITLNNANLEIIYKLPMTSNLSFLPKITPGYTFFNYGNWIDEGTQEGFRIGAGAYIDYSFEKWFAIFVGGDYSVTYPGVTTNAAYKDFFGKVEQLNFSAGVKFTLKD